MHSVLLGTGKISYGLGGALSICDNTTIEFTTKEIKDNKQITVELFDKEGVYCSYPVFTISDSTDTAPIENFISPDIKIYIANTKHLKSYLKSKNDLRIISCCKDGLNSTYTPILNDCDCSGTIVTIDNDKSFAQKADKELANFKVKSSVLDMYCPTEPEYDPERNVYSIFVSRSSIIHFPPQCEDFNVLFPRCLTGSYLISTFAKTDEEFERAVEEKFYLVNLPHTLMALFAWCYLKYDGSRDWKFSDIPFNIFEEMKQECLLYHENICSSWMTKRRKRWGSLCSENKNDQLYAYSQIAAKRITQLYYSGDSVVRIINPASGLSMMKLKKHMDAILDAIPDDTFLVDIALHLMG